MTISYKEYLKLQPDEVDGFVNMLLENNEDADKQEEVLLHVALFTDGKFLIENYFNLIQSHILYPPEIYIHAGDHIAEELIKLFDNDDVNKNHLLMCLAWIGSANVLEFFQSTSKNPPNWTNDLCVPTIEYSKCAGWSIQNGIKEKLIFDEVTDLVKNENKTVNNNEIQTFVELNEHCPFCKRKLITFFKTIVNGKLVNFNTCICCGAYEPIFMVINESGESSWYAENKKWEHFDECCQDLEFDPIEENRLLPRKSEKTSMQSISQFIEINKSQIGGYPTWVQDSEYLSCPQCNESMKFVGQIDMEDVEEYGEGIYYFHYCEKCNMTGSNYQQT